MKLIDLLVQELPKRGGWPDGVKMIEQNYHGKLFDGSEPSEPFLFTGEKFEMVDDWRQARVTREQYEAAAQQPVWNGKGLPPVGTVCEVIVNKEWQKCEILVHTRFGAIDCAVFKTDSVLTCSPEGHFRPIRSERQKAIEEMRAVLTNYNEAGVMYAIEQLYDAGYRKLSD